MFSNRLNRALLLTSLILVGFSSLALVSNLQYRAVVVGSDRDIDDTFNDLSDEGWYPRFILKFEGDARMIFERPRDESQRVSGLEYRADVVRRAREIDDTFNERAGDGWMPRFVFRTGAVNQNWRMIFERDPDAIVNDLEYRAVVIDEGRQVDDKFNQMGADGWEPLFIVESSEDHRMLFVRTKGESSQKWRFMAKVTNRIKEIDDLFDEHGAEGWEPIFVFQDEMDRWRALFKQRTDQDNAPMEYQARRIDEIREVEDKFNQYSADGWYPMFVIPDVEEVYEESAVEGEEGIWVENTRWRMLFSRPMSD